MDDLMIKTAQGGAPTFDGSHSKFALWWKKFRAFAYLNGFGEAIQEIRICQVRIFQALI